MYVCIRDIYIMESLENKTQNNILCVDIIKYLSF